MKELALKFEEKTKEKVVVTAGPTPSWFKKARKDADLIFSGNTSMMDGFIKRIPSLNLEDLVVLMPVLQVSSCVLITQKISKVLRIF